MRHEGTFLSGCDTCGRHFFLIAVGRLMKRWHVDHASENREAALWQKPEAWDGLSELFGN